MVSYKVLASAAVLALCACGSQAASSGNQAASSSPVTSAPSSARPSHSKSADPSRTLGHGSCAQAVRWYRSNADTITRLDDAWNNYNSSGYQRDLVVQAVTNAAALPPLPYAPMRAKWDAAIRQMQRAISMQDATLLHAGGVEVDQLYQDLLNADTSGADCLRLG